MSDHDRFTRRTVLKSLGVTGVAVAGASSVSGRSEREPGPPAGAPGRGRTELTILHDTHVHGRFGDADEAENVEHYFGLMDQLAAQSEHAMRVGNGDDLGSSALSTEFEGRHVVDAFEAGDLAVDTFGNHDFDFGPETLRRRVAESDFQWVTANVYTPDGEIFAAAQGVQPFELREVEDVTVGITGILTERARAVTSLGDNEVRPPAASLEALVPEMRAAGADLVVVLSHVANDVAREVAAAVDGIDVIVGDDAAEVLGAQQVNDTVLAFVGDGYDHLGELTLDIRGAGQRIHDYEFTLYDTSEAVPRLDVEPDTDVGIVADSYRDRIDREVIGRTEVQLNCRAGDLRTRETNMGNFVADTVRTAVDADVAIQNGGGIRTGTLYPAGEITDLMIKQILPFGNTIEELEVTGETLLAALENGVSDVETLEGRFPQVSGLSFDWNPDAAAGDRIESVSIDGDALDPDATYTLGTNNFIGDGGDGYKRLADATVVEATETGLADAVIDRVMSLTPIAPATDGRIERV